VIPETARLQGTVRTFEPKVRDMIERRMSEIAQGTALATGATLELDYQRGYPVTSNHPAQTAFAAKVARDVAGETGVDDNMTPVMGGEDFSYMLEARPGAFIFMGIGPGAGLHNPAYNFNDEAIPAGISFWGRLVETAMPSS
jgi:hippurate hydrolase